jgi:dolichol-phosphate mannosyltransferase
VHATGGPVGATATTSVDAVPSATEPSPRAGLTTPRVSVVIPVYNEGDAIEACLDRILESVSLSIEIVVVYDRLEDTTVPYLEKYAEAEPRVRPTLNQYGPGPANAIHFGIDAVLSPVVVVTMADGSDDPSQIDQLTRLVERGVVVAAASRYSRTGQQVGGPLFKGMLSRLAGVSLYHFARVGTRDATNSFKAYNVDFVRKAGIESDRGFEIGIELVAKARRARLPVAEVPTIWLDRTAGKSNFDLVKWLPSYLKWYRYCFGGKRPIAGLSNSPDQ